MSLLHWLQQVNKHQGYLELQVLKRDCVFLWQACHDAIHCAELLHHQGLLSSAVCSLCKSLSESLLRCLWDWVWRCHKLLGTSHDCSTPSYLKILLRWWCESSGGTGVRWCFKGKIVLLVRWCIRWVAVSPSFVTHYPILLGPLHLGGSLGWDHRWVELRWMWTKFPLVTQWIDPWFFGLLWGFWDFEGWIFCHFPWLAPFVGSGDIGSFFILLVGDPACQSCSFILTSLCINHCCYQRVVAVQWEIPLEHLPH